MSWRRTRAVFGRGSSRERLLSAPRVKSAAQLVAPGLLLLVAATSLNLATPFAVQAELEPASATLVIEPGGSGVELKTVQVPAVPPKADILIAIDTTGSMGPSIAQAKADANAIVTGVQESVPDTHFAVVEFRDAGDDPHYAVRQSMTASASAVQAAIDAMSAGGGGDNAEAHNTVFRNSYTPALGAPIGWREGTKKIVVVISDAEPHGAGTAELAGCVDTTSDDFNTATELAGMAAADRTLFMIRQVAEGTTTTSLECYESIAAAAAPGGAGVNAGSDLGPQIVSLIESSFTAVSDVHLEVVSADEGTEDWVSFDPPALSGVTPPTQVTFDVHVDVPESATPGNYSFVIRAVADGADIGQQTLTVAVPQDAADMTVNTAADPVEDDGHCTVDDCTLREAINRANAHVNSEGAPDHIGFNIGASPATIALTSALPDITDGVVIDGLTQPGATCAASLADNLKITLSGSGGDGLVLAAGSGGSTVSGLVISGSADDGIRVDSNNNTIECNLLRNNGDAGVAVTGGSGNSLDDRNAFAGNGGLGIDLADDGPTANDPADADAGPNDLQNHPFVVRAVPPGTGDAGFIGRLNSTPGTTFTLSFFASDTCDPSGFGEGATLLGTAPVTTSATGDVEFAILAFVVPADKFISATATAPDGSTSEFSPCVPSSPANDAWPRALNITASGQANGFVDSPGQARWYKFSIVPGAQVQIDLTGLPADYDLAVFKDIAQAYTELTEPSDLIRLSAEFAPSAFSPSAFSPSVFSPSAFSPSAFSPSAFSPSAFSPSVFSPSTFSPSVFSPSAFSPSAFSPSAFSPSAFSPSAFSPSAFSPSAFSPSVFSADAFASAQVRSLIGYAATPGTADELVIVNTWNNTGDFYVRVAGRNGVYDATDPFSVAYESSGVTCNAVLPMGAAPADQSAQSINGTPLKTVILTDLARMPGTAGEKSTLQAKLATLAARPDVAAVVVDVGSPRVASLNVQADANPACPYAKNLVADAVKDVVDSYRANNPGLAYVVIVGGDDTIPFFRYPDQSLLGMESGYVPPVTGDSASEASLRLDYVLSQDAYGAGTEISLRASTFPVPDLSVGRLVETATDASGMIDAYLSLSGGVVATPTSTLVTGYDFLQDAADAVSSELAAGTGGSVDELIAPNNISPTDPAAWTADDLRSAFLGSRHDITFLAGHFSANSALAADFSTSLVTTELLSSSVDLTNAIVFSAGCHSGYNIVDDHAVAGLTLPLDWPQAMAQKQATLIAGTGYQYGDTDFIEYSERIYSSFAHELRVGTGPVSIGQALVRAKQEYLRETPDIRGIHEKALLEATVFGLPMLSVDMPSGRVPADGEASVVSSLAGYGSNPGLTLGLQKADLSLDFTTSVTPHTLDMTNVDTNETVTATWYSGNDGTTTNPAEPALPLDVSNVTASGTVLRGVGFRGGSYSDSTVIPLTGAATTEIRGVHAPFTSPVFYPMRMWTPNYFDALNGGPTQLLVTPAQHRSLGLGQNESTLRLYDDLDLRLFYSSSFETFGPVTPALAAPPTITGIAADVDGGDVTFRAHVTGDPAAGIQEVWVTYTGHDDEWVSVDLLQDPNDSTLWTRTMALPTTQPGRQIEFIVQAVNGVGLVSLDDNFGSYHSIATEPAADPAETTLTLAGSNPAAGTYGDTVTVSATLGGAEPASGRAILFSLGGTTRVGLTGSGGVATADLPLTGLPGARLLTVSYAGDADAEPASDSAAFTINKSATTLELTAAGPDVTLGFDSGVTATLTDANGTRLIERTVFFTMTGPAGTVQRTAITNFAGQAKLGTLPPSPGTYAVEACFNGPLSGGPPSCASISVSDSTYSPSGDTISVNHVWPFSGFLQPVENLPVQNVVKAGSTVPMKFSLDGNHGLGIFLSGYPQANPTACTASETNPITNSETTTSNAGLSYDPLSDTYQYDWRTKKNWTGKCFIFEMKLVDGSTRTASFKFK